MVVRNPIARHLETKRVECFPEPGRIVAVLEVAGKLHGLVSHLCDRFENLVGILADLVPHTVELKRDSNPLPTFGTQSDPRHAGRADPGTHHLEYFPS